MHHENAISVENVSMVCRIWESPSGRLTAPVRKGKADPLPAQSIPAGWLKNSARARFRDFRALRSLSFRIDRGESVGIVGRNGSGEFTLIQLMAGTHQHTGGVVQVNGRIVAFLQLGSDFNPEFKGRENVYLSVAVLGLSCTEFDVKSESFSDFADIGDFTNQPLKTYSSRMMKRLAFSVQTGVDPDVLIVDEALSVGDATSTYVF